VVRTAVLAVGAKQVALVCGRYEVRGGGGATAFGYSEAASLRPLARTRSRLLAAVVRSIWCTGCRVAPL